MTFTAAETAACQRLIDTGPRQKTSAAPATSPARRSSRQGLRGQAAVRGPRARRARRPARRRRACWPRSIPRLEFEPLDSDGTRVQPGAALAPVAGPMRAIRTAERTALNFLQRLSGIATQTRRYVDAVGPLPCRLISTRARRCPAGGCWRSTRSAAAAATTTASGCTTASSSRTTTWPPSASDDGIAVAAARKRFGQTFRSTVEVDNLSSSTCPGCPTGRDCSTTWSPSTCAKLSAAETWLPPNVLLEASGGVTLSTVPAIAGAAWIASASAH